MLRFPCAHCDALIEAPLERRGETVACEACGALSVILSPEDIARQLEQERRLENEQAEFRLAARLTEKSSSVRSLRHLSDLLLLFSYLLSALCIGVGAAPWLLGVGGDVGQLLGLTLGGLGAALLFALFKFLSALVQTLSEQLAGQLAMQEQLQAILTRLHEQEEL